MKYSIGDKWINYVIRHTPAENEPHMEKVWLVLGFGQLLLFIANAFIGDINLLILSSSLLTLLVGITSFERRKFVHTIRTQDQVLQTLQVRLAEKYCPVTETGTISNTSPYIYR